MFEILFGSILFGSNGTANYLKDVRHMLDNVLYLRQKGAVKMIAVNIRDLTHHFSKYLKRVKAGEKITILERHIPVADVVPHNENLAQPAWRRPIEKLVVEGEPLAETIAKNRREEKH